MIFFFFLVYFFRTKKYSKKSNGVVNIKVESTFLIF